jgi:hypothetical protein
MPTGHVVKRSISPGAETHRLRAYRTFALLPANDHGAHAIPENVSPGRHGRSLTPVLAQGERGNKERAGRDFHGMQPARPRGTT